VSSTLIWFSFDLSWKTGLLLSKNDFSVRQALEPLNVDGKSMQNFVEVGDILCFVNDQPVKKVHLLIYVMCETQYFSETHFHFHSFPAILWSIAFLVREDCRQVVPHVPTTMSDV
jgi:hypothetical protein